MRSAVKACLVAIALLVLGCASSKSAPKLEHGVLDARAWDFRRDGSISLDGAGWAVFWQRLLTPEQARTAIPSNYGTLSDWPEAKGYLTGRLLVRLPPNTKLITFEFGTALTASEVYFDGKLIRKEGQVSDNPDDARVRMQSFLYDYVPTGERLEIVVRVSNWDYLRGGAYGLALGDTALKHHEITRMYVITAFLLGTMIIMALYHVGLWLLRRQDPAPLYFAGMCFFAACFNFVIGDGIIFEFFPDIDGELWFKLLTISWVLAIPCASYLVHTLFPEEYNPKVLRPTVYLSVGTALIVAAFRQRYHAIAVHPAQLFLLIMTTYAGVVIARARRRRREGSGLMVVGASMLGVTIVNDLLYTEQVSPVRALSKFGLLSLILAMSLLWAARIARTYATLEASQRARTAMFHNTSHELRTPLNGILGFIKLLRRGHFGDLTPGLVDPLHKIQQLAGGLLTQVNTILDLARSQHGRVEVKLAPVPVLELVHEAQNLADGLALREADLHFKLDVPWSGESGPTVGTDRDKVLAILRNLIGNAFKFRRPGAPHTVTLRMRLAQQRLMIEVSDTGIGIARENQEHIFEEFTQVESDANRAYEGTGLGLALVKRLVHSLSGEVRVESTLGKGSTFLVELPAHEAEPVALDSSAEVLIPLHASTSSSSGPIPDAMPLPRALEHDHILVVDDNPTNLELVREVLTGCGYKVVTVDGGALALSHIAHKKPDLVLLDVMMPQVSGEDVLRAIREQAALDDLPVILLTARAAEDDRLLGLRLGADDYLAKPVDPAELVLRVHNNLARARLARAKSQHEANLAAAQAVQQTLLPSTRDFPGVEVNDHYRAAELTGGDWFGYAYDEARTRLFVAVGDATGHGVPAALVTGTAAGAFRATCFALTHRQVTASLEASLQEVVQALNHALLDTGRGNTRPMTMALLALDLTTGEAAYLNAGHQPVFHVHDGQASAIVHSGAPLGVERNAEFTCERMSLSQGDLLFIYTDGLVENEGPDGRTLSVRRVRKLLSEAGDLNELKHSILHVGDSIWRDQPGDDDCSFVVLRFLGDRPQVSGVVRGAAIHRADSKKRETG